MKLTKDNLYRIILEEYLKEEGLQISESKVDDLIAHIKGGPRPDWMGADGRKIPPPPDVPRPEESEYSGSQNDSGPDLEDQLAALIQGMPPEEVADLFQAVFEKIPGVEMSTPEEEPETEYVPGAHGRPVVGFEELKAMIGEILAEGNYPEMQGEIEEMSDYELTDMAERDGIENIIRRDDEGDLLNRDELIAALQDV